MIRNRRRAERSDPRKGRELSRNIATTFFLAALMDRLDGFEGEAFLRLSHREARKGLRLDP
jgi:hypothetical protein